jgi:hypothetical protein
MPPNFLSSLPPLEKKIFSKLFLTKRDSNGEKRLRSEPVTGNVH